MPSPELHSYYLAPQMATSELSAHICRRAPIVRAVISTPQGEQARIISPSHAFLSRTRATPPHKSRSPHRQNLRIYTTRGVAPHDSMTRNPAVIARAQATSSQRRDSHPSRRTPRRTTIREVYVRDLGDRTFQGSHRAIQTKTRADTGPNYDSSNTTPTFYDIFPECE